MTDTASREGDEESVELRSYSDVEYVFEATTDNRPSFGAYVRDAWQRRHFVVASAKAELRGARSRTVLGEIWAVVDPLFMAAIYWFLIHTIRRGSTDDPTERLVILISGIFLFSFTSTMVSSGGRSIVRNKGLLLNSTFPRILMPATEIYKGILDLGPYMAVYAVIHVLIGGPITIWLLAVPLLIAVQVLIGSGLALFFSTLTVYFRDMSNVLDYVMRVLFFATPILYPVGMLPGNAHGILSVVNPFFSLFACFQSAFLGRTPELTDVMVALTWAVVTCVVGYRVFVSRERGFALRL